MLPRSPGPVLSSLATRVLTTVLAFAFAAWWTVLVAPPALAHAELISSNPKDGARLATRPDRVVFTFGESIDPRTARARVDVAADDSADYQYDPQPQVDGETVAVALEDLTEGGRYVVTYRVVSADAHPVEGRVVFTVASAGAGAPPKGDTTSTGDSASGGGTTTAPSATGTASPSAAASPSATTTSGGAPASGDGGSLLGTGSPAFWLLGALGVVAAAGAAVAMATRRRAP